MKLPLSAQQLISCCENCCSSNGGNVIRGWEYVKNNGLVTGGPYNSNIVRKIIVPFFIMCSDAIIIRRPFNHTYCLSLNIFNFRSQRFNTS